ncbi:AMP-dependent synthetase/ligase [Nocardioides litoris]|uniref:AMP-dependent synthetase/ligase n=1 Tax=Nocardioides litoris TaxID=1926648 RepID=UPI00111D6E19|nr:AMP-dependent synthetase/ligase [Nocardioides litoris]
MREYSTPLTVDLPATGNLTDDVVRNAREAPTTATLARPVGDGSWEDVDAAAFLALVAGVAKGLLAAGVEAGDRVVLMSRTRWEWTVLDYAVWFAGAVGVPVYESTTADQLGHVLRDSGAVAVVAETQAHLDRVTAVRTGGDGLDDLRHVWLLEEHGLDVLTRLGADVPDAVLEERRAAAGPDDLATLIYTSGTTGEPRGCMVTHGNLRTEVEVTVAELGALFSTPADEEGERGRQPATLVFLPLPHVFARVLQVGAVRARVRLGHSSDVRRLVPTLQEFRPTFVLGVPRVFEKIVNTASQQAAADGRGPVFDRATDAAIAWSRGLDSPNGRASIAVRARHAAFDRLVYRGVRESLGGDCTFAVSGGAPLGERLAHFYRGCGITVLEGYGLTETTAAITVNLPEAQRVGTVGRPLPGAAVRVADDGELLVRGGQVFTGYWNDPEATSAVLEPDGWFHTGDVGEVDDEGFVRVTGRKKEILVTAGGKNVAPAVLEDRLRAHPLVSQALVVGDGRPFIGALVTLDADALPLWAEAHGRSGRGRGPTAADLVEDPELLADLQAAVDEANTAVSRAESIRRFRVLPTDWTEEGGQLTPSLKLRRSVVLREFRDEIAALYDEGSRPGR